MSSVFLLGGGGNAGSTGRTFCKKYIQRFTVGLNKWKTSDQYKPFEWFATITLSKMPITSASSVFLDISVIEAARYGIAIAEVTPSDDSIELLLVATDKPETALQPSLVVVNGYDLEIIMNKVQPSAYAIYDNEGRTIFASFGNEYIEVLRSDIEQEPHSEPQAVFEHFIYDDSGHALFAFDGTKYVEVLTGDTSQDLPHQPDELLPGLFDDQGRSIFAFDGERYVEVLIGNDEGSSHGGSDPGGSEDPGNNEPDYNQNQPSQLAAMLLGGKNLFADINGNMQELLFV